jgi:integrase/recombinase XerD
MELLQAGIDRSLIAIWLGHESIETTQLYFNASLALKERIMAKTQPFECQPAPFKPDDQLLAFLQAL